MTVNPEFQGEKLSTNLTNYGMASPTGWNTSLKGINKYLEFWIWHSGANEDVVVGQMTLRP